MKPLLKAPHIFALNALIGERLSNSPKLSFPKSCQNYNFTTLSLFTPKWKNKDMRSHHKCWISLSRCLFCQGGSTLSYNIERTFGKCWRQQYNFTISKNSSRVWMPTLILQDSRECVRKIAKDYFWHGGFVKDRFLEKRSLNRLLSCWKNKKMTN